MLRFTICTRIHRNVNVYVHTHKHTQRERERHAHTYATRVQTKEDTLKHVHTYTSVENTYQRMQETSEYIGFFSIFIIFSFSSNISDESVCRNEMLHFECNFITITIIITIVDIIITIVPFAHFVTKLEIKLEVENL